MKGMFGISREDKKIAEEAMEKTKIAALAEREITRLSGGQLQLALIARALAQQTPLILLDEPTSALDFSNQMMVWEGERRVALNILGNISLMGEHYFQLKQLGEKEYNDHYNRAAYLMRQAEQNEKGDSHDEF